MAYEAKILADSTHAGKRLTTVQATYPRFVHSELMTHRMFSRNSASSRALPTEKLMKQIREDPAGPVWWGKNQSGMQAREELVGSDRAEVEAGWLHARDRSLASASMLASAGLHKQIANRLLEPWMWITVIISATEWENFFRLRCHADAQPEIAKMAYMVRDLMMAATPREVAVGDWHLPFFRPDDIGKLSTTPIDAEQIDARRVCVARCARVSYLTHDGVRDPIADLDLCGKLEASGHWSPFEHVATPAGAHLPRIGNFIGWRQYRADVDPNFIW